MDHFSVILFIFVQWSISPEGNILHCMKKAQNKTRISQWRLLLNLANFVVLRHPHICSMRLKWGSVNYEKYRTLSIYENKLVL